MTIEFDFISEEQRQIVTDPARIKLVQGVAGSRKTDSLIKCGMHYLQQGKNVIFLTKISSVTDEITKRMKKDFGILFDKSASHFYAPTILGKPTVVDSDDSKNINWCSVANYDSFIDKQLRMYDIPFEGEAFNQKVRQLYSNVDKIDKGLFMKNNAPVDVVLIDEVQDFDKIRIQLTCGLFNKLSNLQGVFVGDTLQTVFIQSIMGESFSMNYLKSQLDCKYFQLTTCYRCPKGQIDFVNKVMRPYQERYCIDPMKSNNDNLDDKAVVFQHHSVHKEYERADLCNRVIYLVDYVLNKDSTVTPDDIVVVMNKTNSNAVFEKLLVELNRYYVKRYNNKNYQNVIHYKTKNHEGRKTIDWSIGEEKTKFISVHGIKGKGQRVVILLGMSEKSIPMVEWLFKTEELISQSVMNVALTRSEKYLFIGVNSIPSRYINDQLPDVERDKLAYCSWNKDTYNDAPKFYNDLLTGFEKFEQFNFIGDKYTKDIVCAPSKSVLAIKEDIVQEFHISDCIANAFALLTPEVMNKQHFGGRLTLRSSFNIVERAILGVLSETLVQRYMRLKTKKMEYDNAFLWSYYGSTGLGYFYTNNQSLLNVVFDLKLNSHVKNPQKWHAHFAIIQKKCKHLSHVRQALAGIKSPTYILDVAFQRMDIQGMLDTYFSFTPNEQIPTRILWNLALFFSALSGNYKMTSVMMYTDAFNKDLAPIHKNVKSYCHKYLLNSTDYNLAFQKEITVVKKITDKETLKTLCPHVLEKEDGQQFYRYGIMGVSDIVQQRKDNSNAILHEIKAISCSDPGKVKTWIFQSVLYTYLLKKLSRKTQNNVEKIVIVNLLSGTSWEFNMNEIAIKYRDMMTYILKEKRFPDELIEGFLEVKVQE